jgi:hypothetical protein
MRVRCLFAGLRGALVLLLLAGGLGVGMHVFAPRVGEARGHPCVTVQDHPLPLPSTVDPARFVDYEKLVLGFLQRGEYKALHWCVDKGVRDTGPFVQGVYYGTHPAVRIFYSPGVMRWLLDGRRGTIPDGAMIIKEQ